ncbi:fimbria/pilus outer membrane usher protein [Vibrio agarivorans]|uniref:fimbria/pilus outer membrane usher protein n=1 Tax=Vibrio agarivorans TaxID=153622 RepID=UPI0022325566|nr:fimbria/pilus outer membrane usher protein [Vibrio agarivorans]
MRTSWIKLKSIVLVLSMIFSAPSKLAAQEWLFPLPLYLGTLPLGNVQAYSDGVEVSAISKPSIDPMLQQILTEAAYRRFEHLGEKMTVEQLDAIGVSVVMNASDLSLIMSIDSEAAREQQISFNNEYQKPIYSQAGFLAWHNIFNFSTDYQANDSYDNSDNYLGEWITSGNIGGVRGLNFETSGYASTGSLTDSSFYRGDAKLYVDNPDRPWRVSMGDVSLQSIGHIPSVELGGLAWERLYSEIQPTRNIQNGGTQAITLNESAELEVYVNDIFVSEFRLPPGRYLLDDLPLDAGSNDIRIEIRYVSGRTDTIVYSQFFNARLLREGISDFGVYAGLVSSIEDDKYEYDQNQTVGSAFYEYGVTDYLTVGANGVYHPDGNRAGAVVTLGTDWGNIGLRASSSYNKQQSEQGGIVSLDYAHQIWGADSYGLPNFRLSAEYQTDYNAIPWGDVELDTGYSVTAGYLFDLSLNTDLNFNGSYESFDGYEDKWYLSGELGWQLDDWSISGGVEHEEDPNEDLSDTRFIFSVAWSWSSETSDHSANVSYSSTTEKLRARFQKSSNEYVGSYGYRLTAEGDEDTQTYSGLTNYVGNRFNAEAEYGFTHDEDNNSHDVSARISTALSVVDNNVGWGRPYSGSVAIINVHRSLDADVYVNALADDEPESISTRAISNLASLDGGHVEAEVFVSSPDAPIGYNLGPSAHSVTAGSVTGHVIQVGSEASKTIIGTFTDSEGVPIELQQGRVENEDMTVSFFTNKAGRFVLEGIAAGDYQVWLDGFDEPVGILTIQDDDTNLVYLPTIKLEGVEHDDELPKDLI